MLPFAKRLGLLALVGAAALLWISTAADAQTTRTSTTTIGNNSNVGIRVGPGVMLNNPGNSLMNNPYNPSTGGFTCYGYCPGGQNFGCYGSGYGYGGGGYGGGYGGSYCEDPYNGFLTGAASVISAQGQFMISRRQAQVIQQQAKQAAVDTQRKIYEEWKYEKNDQPTLEQIRREAIERAYKMDRFFANSADIWSASALNRIFEHAARIQGQGTAGSTIDLDDELIKKLNFSTGVAGNIAALKDKGKLNWPAAFNQREFDTLRDRFNHLAEDAYRQGVQNNKVDAGTLQDMSRDLKVLEEKLAERIHDESPDDYIDAKHYLNELKQAIRTLNMPDVAKHLNNEYAVQAKNVGELVKKMSSAGVRFAPARRGEEWAYNALYKALVSYDLGLADKAGSNP